MSCGRVELGLGHAALLTDFNLVVFGDLDSQTEVEGKTFVGGDLSGSASNYGVAISLPDDEAALVVGGSITAGNVSVNAGAMSVVGDVGSGTRNTIVNMNSGGDYVVGGTVFGQVNNGNPVASLDVPTLGEIRNYYESLSGYYASLPANSTLTVAGSQALYSADASVVGTLAVFEVTASEAFDLPSTVSQLVVEMNGASGVIVNVLGAEVEVPSSLNSVGEILDDETRERVVWNFVDATSLTINPNFNGMVLAPHAAVTNRTAIDGQVVVDHFVQRGQVHLPLSRVTPEPSSAALLAAAAAFVTARRQPRHAGAS